ncbi:MAG: hypothetical protein RL462_1137 [Pseudomonadota bacterium]|jgi:hypothetical protein
MIKSALKPRTRKTAIHAVRMEKTLFEAMIKAAEHLGISEAELTRRALLRECERLGCHPV